MLAHLSRYTHRVAIANSRLVAFDGERVTFKWTDYRAKGDARYKPMTLVIRDVMFGNRRHCRELLHQSEEGIASNILADRLKRLVAAGLLSWKDDPSHMQKGVYSLTEPAIQLVPLLAQMGAWGRRHAPASDALSIRAQVLEEGGPALWDAFMQELRSLHLGGTAPERSVLGEFQAAFKRIANGKA